MIRINLIKQKPPKYSQLVNEFKINFAWHDPGQLASLPVPISILPQEPAEPLTKLPCSYAFRKAPLSLTLGKVIVHIQPDVFANLYTDWYILCIALDMSAKAPNKRIGLPGKT